MLLIYLELYNDLLYNNNINGDIVGKKIVGNVINSDNNNYVVLSQNGYEGITRCQCLMLFSIPISNGFKLSKNSFGKGPYIEGNVDIDNIKPIDVDLSKVDRNLKLMNASYVNLIEYFLENTSVSIDDSFRDSLYKQTKKMVKKRHYVTY